MRLFVALLLMSLAAASGAAPDGARLYATHCAACHGDKGTGGVGTPLALSSFLESVDDGFLTKTIRYGRPGRVMPAFSALSDSQLNALVGYLRGWSKQPAPTFTATTIAGDPVHGKALFSARCASCHGINGEGGLGTGVTFSRQRDLPIIAPALNNPGFLASASDEMIRHQLEVGREGTPMQLILSQGLSTRDIDDLVVYIRSFEAQQQPAGEPDATLDETIIAADSPYSLEETVENLKESIIGKNFLLVRTDFLEHGLVEEGKEDKREVILHFCNFKFLYDALAIDPRVGMFLPCSVTVVERAGKVKVMTINPLYLSRLFNNNELDDACKQMHDLYKGIIEDATQ